MASHTVTFVATTTPTDYPAGTTIGPIVATILTAIGGSMEVLPVNLDSSNTAVFPSVPDGNFVLSVQATDGSGAPLGAAYTVALVVTDPPVVIHIPTGGTITIS